MTMARNLRQLDLHALLLERRIMHRLLIALFSMCCCGFASLALAGEVVIDASTTIDGRYEEAGLRIVAGANPQTTVHFVDPAYVEQTVYVEDDSVWEMTGGEIHDSLYLFDASVANLTGGTIGDTVRPSGFSSVTVNGATLSDYVYSEEFSLVTVLKGDLWGTVARGGSLISIWGGDFGALDQETSLIAEDSATIYVYGRDFNYARGPIGVETGSLTGVLADGTPFQGTFAQHGDGAIILIPEPATLPLLISAFGGMAWTLTIRRSASGLRK
jgi:hypothetical protein